MDDNLLKAYESKLETLKNRLEARNFKVSILNNKEELLAYIKELIPNKASVSLGGSVSLQETGILDELSKMDINLVDRYKEGLTRAEREELLRQGLLTDYFLTSTNAISMDGALYNIDGTGNRVAAMCFGPKNVLVICGINKICLDEQEAISRVKNVAAIANAIRLNKNVPCTKLGYCVDCKAEKRICASHLKIDYSLVKDRIHIIFVKENLGY